MAKHVYLLIILISTYLEMAFFVTCNSTRTQIPHPLLLRNGSMHESLDVSLREALVQAQNDHEIILNMDLSRFNDRAKTAWADCKYLYEDTIHELSQSIASKNNHFDVQIWLSGAIANLQTCEQGFLEFGLPNLSSLELANDNLLSKLVSNALAINKAIFSTSSTERKILADDFPQWVSAGDQKLLQYSSPSTSINPDIVVAKDGSGKYSTISEGLDAAADIMNDTGRIVIYVKKGIYKENLLVKNSLKNITLIGDGIGATIVTGHKSVGDGYTTLSSATFSVYGQGFIAMRMTFENTAGAEKSQAVALLCAADRSVFYQCSFKGYQDTLWTYQHRQFYRDCDIYGTVDFIFGDAATIIQNSNIYLRQPIHGQKNVITAQGKSDPHSYSGIVVHSSRITAAPGETPAESYLGRPWKLYSTAIFIKCDIDSVIEPKGWLPYKDGFAFNTLNYGEYKNTGAGAHTDRRVTWPGYHVITSADDAEKFTVESFLDGRSWLPETGVPFTAGL